MNYFFDQADDMDAVSDGGSSQLYAACGDENLEMVEFLVQQGADIHERNNRGETCLMESVQSAPLCEYLISNGADVHARDIQGKTALHHAIAEYSLETVRLLLDYGANALDKNSDGDDAMQTACLVGAVEIMRYLMERISYSSERLADAFELLGATLVDFNNETVEATNQWSTALQIRWSGCSYIRKQPMIAPRSSFGNAVEILTDVELKAIALNGDAVRMQGLMIYERILGIDHEHSLWTLMDKGFLYEENREYQRCIDLWLLALQVRIEKHSVLQSQTCNSATAIVRLMINLIPTNDDFSSHNLALPRFKDVLAVFQALFANITEARELLCSRSNDRMQQKNYDSIVHCLAHLIYLLLSTARSEDELGLVKNCTRELVQCNVQTVSNETLLHLSVSKLQLIESPYFMNDTDVMGIFPNLKVAKLLLECGADVHAYDASKSTPLLIASKPLNHNRQIVRSLIEHGAHLDLPNKCGEHAFSLLAKNSANDIILGNHISLRCISASAAAKPCVPNRTILPRWIKQFIRAHET